MLSPDRTQHTPNWTAQLSLPSAASAAPAIEPLPSTVPERITPPEREPVPVRPPVVPIEQPDPGRAPCPHPGDSDCPMPD